MYNRIEHQFVGFINTPSIFNNSNFAGFKLFELNSNKTFSSSSISQQKFPNNLVLGKRVEYFFMSAINASKGYELITNNIQINDEQRTLGELDFIVKDLKTKKLLHIELMYKFYVYDPEFKIELERWIGPNRKDSLLQKIQRVNTNQFPLLHTPEAEKYLKSIDIDSESIQQQICFKANLFIPKNMQTQKFSQINENCIIGYWIHFKDFGDYDQEAFYFFAPEKQDWPIAPENWEEWINFKDVNEQIKELHLRKKSPLIWIKKSDGSFERIIVVWW